jgi:iron complex outermembrane receptor protein
VITADDIEAMGATTLEEVLETVPGLHVSLSKKHVMRSVYSIRGIQTSLNPQVLLLVNGHPVRDVYTGCRSAAVKMLTSSISRVEIIRGPGSAVYGADAFAGTINVITKDSSEINGTTAGLRYGSFATAEAWLQHGGRYAGWDVAVHAAGRESSGDSDRIIDADLQTTIDAALGTSASVAPNCWMAYHLRTSRQLLRRMTGPSACGDC